MKYFAAIKSFPASCTPIVEEGYVNIYGRDVTDRKQAEAEVLAANAHLVNEKNLLQAVMETLPVGVAIIDPKGGRLQSNAMFDHIWGGIPPPVGSISDYAIYKAWWVDTGEVVQPEEWASAIAIKKGETVVGQLMQIQRFDGTRAFVMNSAAPILDSRDKTTGSAVAILDITDRMTTEEALRQSDQRHQLATSVAKEAIWDVNLVTGKVQWNKAYAELFGRPDDADSHGPWWLAQIHPHDRARVDSSFAKTLAEDGDLWLCEYRMKLADGSYAFINDRAIIVRDKAGKPLRAVAQN